MLVLNVELAEQELLVRARSDAFFLTPHYHGYLYVLVRLEAVAAGELRDLITDAWLLRAPKRLAAAFVAESS